MFQQLRDRSQNYWQSLKKSPIKYLNLGLKDDRLDREFKLQRELDSRQRAIGYLFFLLLMSMMQGISVLSFQANNKPVLFVLMMLGVTVIFTALLIIASRIRSKIIHAILPINVVFRGLLMLFATKIIYRESNCKPLEFSLVTSGISFTLFLAEISIFQAQLLSFLSFFILGTVDAISKNNTAYIPNC